MRPGINLKTVKEYTHCGEKYRLKKRIAQFDMDGKITHNIFLSDKKTYEGDKFCLAFVQWKGEKTARLVKITDAYTLWFYWTEPERQAWILERDDSELWKEARKVIETWQKKYKNKDLLPLIHW